MTTAEAAAPYQELESGHAEIVWATLPLIGAHIDEVTGDCSVQRLAAGLIGSLGAPGGQPGHVTSGLALDWARLYPL